MQSPAEGPSQVFSRILINAVVWEKDYSKRLKGPVPSAHTWSGTEPFPTSQIEKFILHGTLSRVLRKA